MPQFVKEHQYEPQNQDMEYNKTNKNWNLRLKIP